MIIIFVIILILIIIGIAGLLIFVGKRNPEADNDRILLERLEEFNQKGVDVSLEKLEMSQPFTERVIFPLARNFGQFVVKYTPQNALQNISHMLELAGSPSSIDPQIFLAIQIIMAVFLSGLMFLLFTFGSMHLDFIFVLIIVLVAAAIGYGMPILLLQS